MFVVDCSMTMAWLFDDEKSPSSEKVLDRLNNEPAVVPSLWILEVINVLLVGEKRKRITPSQTTHFLNVLNNLPIQIIENETLQQSESLLFLARTYGLTSYDSAYLDLASRQGLPLATLDAQLIKAAQTLGIQILS